ncbi:acyl-CoA thioesterase [Bacillaceae bacterium S4-13-58]
MEAKRCKDSLSIKNSFVLPPDTNSHGTLFGGKLMAYIDDIGGIAAARHARKPVVTASTDSVDFLHPVFEGNTICVEAFVTWSHNTSMEVFVKAISENMLTGERKICTLAFLTFVAVDENGRPIDVPLVYPETNEEKWLHESAPQRAERRKERRTTSRELAKKFGTGLPWD